MEHALALKGVIMPVEFQLHLLDANRHLIKVSEAQLNANFALYQVRLSECDELQGALVFTGSSMPVLEISDALWQSVLQLCFRLGIQLADGHSEVFLYRCYTHDRQFVFIPTGSQLRIMASNMPMLIFNKKELLLSLYKCGLRYCKFIQKLKTLGRSDWSIDLLQSEADRARKALPQRA